MDAAFMLIDAEVYQVHVKCCYDYYIDLELTLLYSLVISQYNKANGINNNQFVI